MKHSTSAKWSTPASALSDEEVRAAICYLEPRGRRGTGDLVFTMVLCWMILLFSTLYLVLHLRP